MRLFVSLVQSGLTIEFVWLIDHLPPYLRGSCNRESLHLLPHTLSAPNPVHQRRSHVMSLNDEISMWFLEWTSHKFIYHTG